MTRDELNDELKAAVEELVQAVEATAHNPLDEIVRISAEAGMYDHDQF